MYVKWFEDWNEFADCIFETNYFSPCISLWNIYSSLPLERIIILISVLEYYSQDGREAADVQGLEKCDHNCPERSVHPQQ